VARNAQTLQVLIIIRAASCDVDDVVNLKVCAYVPAPLAGVLVAQQDGITLTTPWPAASATAPGVRQGILYACKLPRFSHLHARFDGF
jgi:hypothetical protein